jgi:hypothetical protein
LWAAGGGRTLDRAMIRFTNVQGDVLVDDRKKDDRIMAYPGLALDPGGDYLVATTQSSSAEIHAFGKFVRVAPFSFLRIGGNRVVEGKHTEFWIARNTKLFLATLWRLAGGRI